MMGAVQGGAPFPAALLQGYRTFKAGRFSIERERYRQLAETGQKPATLIVACCDSRAAPEIIFNALPGEVFVVRNVANLVPPYEPDNHFHATSAALEFAVRGLKVENIVVMGHGRCGGIQAALNPSEPALSPGDFIGKWVQLLEEPAKAVADQDEMSPAERQTALERMSIRQSIANLRTFPFVDTPERQGRLTLHGAWFDIADGDLWLLDGRSGEFKPALDMASG